MKKRAEKNQIRDNTINESEKAGHRTSPVIANGASAENRESRHRVSQSYFIHRSDSFRLLRPGNRGPRVRLAKIRQRILAPPTGG
jgi:hypothetical protein